MSVTIFVKYHYSYKSSPSSEVIILLSTLFKTYLDSSDSSRPSYVLFCLEFSCTNTFGIHIRSSTLVYKLELNNIIAKYVDPGCSWVTNIIRIQMMNAWSVSIVIAVVYLLSLYSTWIFRTLNASTFANSNNLIIKTRFGIWKALLSKNYKHHNPQSLYSNYWYSFNL